MGGSSGSAGRQFWTGVLESAPPESRTALVANWVLHGYKWKWSDAASKTTAERLARGSMKRTMKGRGPKAGLPQSIVDDLLARGVIERACSVRGLRRCYHPEKLLFIMSTSTVPKPDGRGRRPIFDARPLNELTTPDRFCLPTLRGWAETVRDDDLVFSADLRDAYQAVALHPDVQRMCAFRCGDDVYFYRALPFGTNFAPFVFTAVMDVVRSVMDARGVSAVAYLDDFLVRTNALDPAIDVLKVVNTLAEAGFVVHPTKSALAPCRRLTALGIDADFEAMVLRVTAAKARRLRGRVRALLSDPSPPTVRAVASVLGSLGSLYVPWPTVRMLTRSAVSWLNGQLTEHLRADLDADSPTDCWRHGQLRREAYNLLVTMWPMPQHVVDDLSIARARLRSLPESRIHLDAPSLFAQSDASLTQLGGLVGYGDFDGGANTSSWEGAAVWSSLSVPFSISPVATQINAEAAAALATLRHLIRECESRECCLRGRVVRVLSDSQSLLGALRRGSSSAPFLAATVRAMLELAAQHRFFVVGSWMSGKSMGLVDCLSRPDRLERKSRNWWTVDQQVLDQARRQLGVSDTEWGRATDLTSHWNSARAPRFVSKWPTAGARAADCFSVDWRQLARDGPIYANPEFTEKMINKVLDKFEREQPQRLLLLLPMWPQNPWYQRLLKLSHKAVPLQQSQQTFSKNDGMALMPGPSAPAFQSSLFELRGTPPTPPYFYASMAA
jgi:hypothetical protein